MIERKIRAKCPECGNKDILDKVTTMRTNYPFGKKSKPRFIPKIVKYFCHKVWTDREGNITKRCGFKTIVRLNRGEYDFVGG